MKWTMVESIKKIKEFEFKYPELKRAKEIVRNSQIITDMYSKDDEIERAIVRLETLLKQKNDGN